MSVRELRAAIGRKAYERREIANSQIPEGSAVPHDSFTDPLILDALGLRDVFVEKDLEAACSTPLGERRDLERVRHGGHAVRSGAEDPRPL